jgi:hypothetical protein
MVKAYFESTKDGITPDGKWAELVAIFDNENTYSICIEVLEKYAEQLNMVLTESVEEQSIDDIK